MLPIAGRGKKATRTDFRNSKRKPKQEGRDASIWVDRVSSLLFEWGGGKSWKAEGGWAWGRCWAQKKRTKGFSHKPKEGRKGGESMYLPPFLVGIWRGGAYSYGK